jgi:hypothetical protein
MRRLHIPPLIPIQTKELDHLYRTTKAPRLRTRAQMVLLSVEQGLKVPRIAAIVRESEATVLRWLKCYLAEGIAGLQDAPRPGFPSEVNRGLSDLVARCSAPAAPESGVPPFSLWMP